MILKYAQRRLEQCLFLIIFAIIIWVIFQAPGIIDKLIAADEAKFGEYWAPRITEIVERYLGKGIKVNDCSREQVEALDLILSDLKELL